MLLLAVPGTAFSPSTNIRSPSTKLYGGDFDAVKEEIKQKASAVDAKDEIKYAPSTLGEEVVSLDMTAKIERMTKPRAYPLFLAEKGAAILEDSISSFFKDKKGSDTNVAQKERVVILGTGWGSVAFLKDIDTDRYDVTVISPRNHFLFTPMLAGASVGTVEYRSITESIREVCFH